MEEVEKLKKKIEITAKSDPLQYQMEMGNLYNKTADYKKALQHYEKALAISQKTMDRAAECKVLHFLSVIYKKQNNLTKALKLSEESLNIAVELDDKNSLAAGYNSIGVIYKTLTDYDRALEYYLKSLRLREELNDRDSMSNVVNNIGVVYNQMGDYEKALSYFNRSLQIRMKIGDNYLIAASLNNIGNLYLKLKEFPRALNFYQRSLKIKQEINDKEGMAITLNNVGLILKNQKKFKEALEHYKRSLSLKEEIGDKLGLTATLLNIANVYLNLKEYEYALSFTDRAHKYATDLKNPEMLMECCNTYASIYASRKDYKNAYENNQKYNKLKDKFLDQNTRNKIAELNTKYEIEKNQREAEIYRLRNIELVEANKSIKQKNEELQRHREHLKLINKILRHDLMNKLAVASSALHLFQDSGNSDLIDESIKSLGNSVDLINRMKDLEIFISTHENLKIYSIEEIINTVIPSYPSLSFSISGAAKVLADDAINSVIDNIISNAFIHSGTDRMEIQINNRNRWCEIRFADFGIGIPENIQDKIFQESFTYGKTANTGLGLFIVKKAVARYGGSIHVENNSPQGSVFVLNLRNVS
ncbi:MAG: tetratricopeptide repeat protein [Candidatus Cloacimonetes bacterium]|nr:tetratricopeptide repeat protein [Candidatus Cloacimonadota bacterium]